MKSEQEYLKLIYEGLGGIVLSTENSNSYSEQGWLFKLYELLGGGVEGGFSSGGVTISETKPTSPSVGDRWYKPLDGNELGSSGEWYWNGLYWLSDVESYAQEATNQPTAQIFKNDSRHNFSASILNSDGPSLYYEGYVGEFALWDTVTPGNYWQIDVGVVQLTDLITTSLTIVPGYTFDLNTEDRQRVVTSVQEAFVNDQLDYNAYVAPLTFSTEIGSPPNYSYYFEMYFRRIHP